MKSSVKKITPAIAKEWLEKNKGNRPINWSHVRLLARDMKLGRWRLNGETIIMALERLLDGQHRLLAVIESGCTIESLVVEGMDAGVFETLNIGKIRNAPTIASLLGHTQTKTLCAAVRVIDQYDSRRMAARARFSVGDTLALIDAHPGVHRSICVCDKVKNLAPKSILVAFHYLFSRIDPQEADAFIEALKRGANLAETDPVYLLRERLRSNALAKAKLSDAYIAALIVKAWNAKRERIVLRNLRYIEEGKKPESFPVISAKVLA